MRHFAIEVCPILQKSIIHPVLDFGIVNLSTAETGMRSFRLVILLAISVLILGRFIA